MFYYWGAECESEGHHQIRQKKVNLIELIDIFSEMAILINLLYSVMHQITIWTQFWNNWNIHVKYLLSI